MKKKSLKNLQLNKVNISKIDHVDALKGGDTLGICTATVTPSLVSQLFCSVLAGSCDCPDDPIIADPDNTRSCPSWNVAC